MGANRIDNQELKKDAVKWLPLGIVKLTSRVIFIFHSVRKWHEFIKIRTIRLKEAGILPKVTVLQIGTQPDSTLYISKKRQACQKTGILLDHRQYNSINYKESLPIMEDLIAALNQDATCHGILLQLPVPPPFLHLGHAICPEKDVDGYSG
jgi:5,10-methylene-tetrahydrofolate dehydrogenase/methenyl tetrahydrofolate cyclohydrolase